MAASVNILSIFHANPKNNPVALFANARGAAILPKSGDEPFLTRENEENIWIRTVLY